MPTITTNEKGEEFLQDDPPVMPKETKESIKLKIDTIDIEIEFLQNKKQILKNKLNLFKK